MIFKAYRDESRINWGTESNKGLTLEQINTGALLRIADASEKMAQRHTELIRDRDYWERRCRNAEESLNQERRRTAALRGHLKRAKSKADGIVREGRA